MKIAFIPLDDRPVSYTLPQQIAKMSRNNQIFLPPRNFLGGLTKYSDVNSILDWLNTCINKEKPDCVVVSLDTIAYGGLISSRRNPLSIEEINENLEKFKQICGKTSAKIYAFSSIMRISDSYVNEEEKSYWDRFGKEIFRYSYLKHKLQTTKNAPLEEDFENLKKYIPNEILSDYINTRERNFQVNKNYFEWVESCFLDFMVFSKDDTGEYGINVLEAEELERITAEKSLDNKVIIHTGADEIPSDLVTRAIVDNFGKKVSLFTAFSTPNGKKIISRYEDKTIEKSALGQIKLCGAEEATSETVCDLKFLVHTPTKSQNDHCLRIYTEQENMVAISSCVDFITKSKLPVILGDVAFANGSDDFLIKNLFAKPQSFRNIYAYSGWNTTGNTLGSALSLGISRYIAEQTQSFDEDNYMKALITRICDDWGYQTILRQKIRDTSTSADKEVLEKELIPLVLNISNLLGYCLDELVVDFPWNRTFEVEIIL